jgi:hypothetical protein
MSAQKTPAETLLDLVIEDTAQLEILQAKVSDRDRIIHDQTSDLLRAGTRILILQNMLAKWLDDFECRFESDEKLDSYEIGQDYIEHATYLRDFAGRKGDIIRRVKDEQNKLPY